MSLPSIEGDHHERGRRGAGREPRNAADPEHGAVRELPAAAAEARDRILAAIATEAEHVNARHPGEGAAALAEPARAYGVATGAADVARPALVGPEVSARAVFVKNGEAAVPGGATGTLPFALTCN